MTAGFAAMLLQHVGSTFGSHASALKADSTTSLLSRNPFPLTSTCHTYSAAEHQPGRLLFCSCCNVLLPEIE
jgi:hypothetical protein